MKPSPISFQRTKLPDWYLPLVHWRFPTYRFDRKAIEEIIYNVATIAHITSSGAEKCMDC
jgi:hypothetical protein